MSNRHYIIPVFVPQIGCPHACVFCNQDSITGEAGVAGSTGKIDGPYVEETIKSYLETINGDNAVVEVSFFGGTFTGINMCKQRELLAVAQKYKSMGKIKYIRLSTRPDYIDEKILDHLKSFDVDIIELGVQSLDEEVLHRSGRGHSAVDVVKASSLINKYGFTLGHQIMLGLPGDTREKDIETVKKSIAMKPAICRIYPSLVIKNTPMETLFLRGEYAPYSLEEAVQISKEIYGMLEASDIKVIRIGLQPTEEINVDGDIVAGPFHPAFRELVESSIYCDIINEAAGKSMNNSLEVHINPKDISILYADKKKNFNGLREINPDRKFKIVQDEKISRGTLGFVREEGIDLVSEKGYFSAKYNK